ncbi:hypothetical protein TeGR_g10249, partial [Tetraparma gracilis]
MLLPDAPALSRQHARDEARDGPSPLPPASYRAAQEAHFLSLLSASPATPPLGTYDVVYVPSPPGADPRSVIAEAEAALSGLCNAACAVVVGGAGRDREAISAFRSHPFLPALSLLAARSSDHLVLLRGPPPAARRRGEERRAILTVSASALPHAEERPWVDSVVGRLSAWGRTCNATVVVETAVHAGCVGEYVEGGGRDRDVALRWCSMRAKLGRLSQLLTEYDRVAIVDDTALIRGDAPDLFDLVPPDMLGGTIEGPEIRPAGERELFLTAACEKYTPAADCSAAAKDGVVVNTGFLILSKEVADDLFGPHRTGGAEDGWGIDIDLDLYGDQGYINALLNSPESVGRGVVDLGYEFNYVGSLETTNRDRIELRAADA